MAVINKSMHRELLDVNKFSEYLYSEIYYAFWNAWNKQLTIMDFEFLYGEGSYEEFIFGGAPGL